MNRKFLCWEDPCKAIIFFSIVLGLIGVLNIYSATNYMEQGLNPAVKQFVFGLLALAVGWGVRRKFRQFLQRDGEGYGTIISAAGVVVLVLLLATKFFPSVNGAHRWIFLGPLSLQPSEFAKIMVLLSSSYYCARQCIEQGSMSYFNSNAGYGMGWVLLFGGLVTFQPDMGTAVIIIGLGWLPLFLAGLPWTQVGATILAGLCAVVPLIVLQSFRMDRIKVWLDPWIEPLGKGFQAVQAQIAIGSGGVLGAGWGQGLSKYGFLPENHTDFAFSFFCQENGLLGALLLILLFTLLGLAMVRTFYHSQSLHNRLLGTGIVVYIIGQSLANMAMNLGVLPVIGMPMLFISYGGSSLLSCAIGIGILLALHDHDVDQEQLEQENQPQLYIKKTGRQA